MPYRSRLARRTSSRVSGRCVWIGRSSCRAYMTIFSQRRVADRVGRVRREREARAAARACTRRARRGLPAGSHRRRRRTASGKSSTGRPSIARMPRLDVRARRRVGKEIHVVAAGDAAARASRRRRAACRRRRTPARRTALSRGQMCSSSQRVERQVVGDAAQQAHRRMRVRVDEPGQQHVRRQRRRARARA